MGREYRIHIKGEQREDIDADLMAHLVVMLGRQLAEDARQAIQAKREGDVAAAEQDRTADEPGGGKRS